MQTIGQYEILEVLGSGGMGTVYRAQHQRLGRVVALKVPSSRIQDDDAARRRFVREARAAAAVNHPNVATLYEFDEQESDGESPVLYLTMEYVPGQDLKQVLEEEGPLPRERVLGFALQIARGLQAAHRARVVHRDLKPANIRLTPDGTLKILDLGLARFTENQALQDQDALETRVGAVMGTPAYMSPEQVLGVPATERSDLFSFGVVLYQMVSGRLPFGSSAAECLRAIQAGEFEPLTEAAPNTDPELALLVKKLLSTDPSDRPSSAGEVINIVTNLRVRLSDESQAETMTSVATGQRARPKFKYLVGGVSVILAMALALAFPLWLKSGSSPSPTMGLAVLPFENQTGDPSLEFIARGLGSALTAELSSFPNVRVLSQTVSAAYESSPEGYRNLAKEFGLGHLVEGQVQLSGQLLRVRVSLLDPSSGAVIWSEPYDEVPSRLFLLQARLAEGLCSRLVGCSQEDSESTIDEPGTRSTGAYQDYLHGLVFLEGGTAVDSDPDGLDSAISFLRRSVAADPDFTEAHTALAGALARRRKGDDLVQAIALAERASSLDPTDPQTLLLLARLYREAERYEDAEDILARARSVSSTLVLDELVAEEEIVSEIDLLLSEASIKEAAADFSGAEEIYRQAIDLDQKHWVAWHGLGTLYLQGSDFEQAQLAFEQALELAPPDEALPWHSMLMLLLMQGRPADALEAYGEYAGPITDPILASNMGTIYYQLGDLDRSLVLMGKAVLLQPGNPTLHGNLGDVLAKSGQVEPAQRRYLVALSLAENRLEAQPELDSLALDVVFYQAKAGLCSEALPRAKDLIGSLRPSAQLFHDLARSVALCDDSQTALVALERAIALGAAVQIIATDDEFLALRDDPRFERLLSAGSVADAEPR